MADATGIELTIKGDVEVMRVKPGDTIIVRLATGSFNHFAVEAIRDRMKEVWPDNQVVFVDGDLRFTVGELTDE